MPVPFPPGGGGFAMVGSVAGPLMMVAMAFSQRGPVRTLLKADADAPERARRAASLGIDEAHLVPLMKSGVVVREADGCVWVVREKARRRSWKIMLRVGAVVIAIGAVILAIFEIGG